MDMLAIKVEGLGKRYKIGERQSYSAMHEKIEDLLLAPFRIVSNLIRQLPRDKNRRDEKDRCDEIENEYIWSLRNLSFEINHGEVVGIIGHNGAGKSVLLKLLSRITKPTEGYAEIYGRVGSMLEVGTGFHPDLTGRENVYLNGTILGMKKKEVEMKFDDIVSFSGVEKLLDTPVKRYSSGMRVRLAFAVAAHLEPEIMLIDEVLAIGDQAFQEQCLRKIKEMASAGRTILFVSHNMNAVQSLCHRAILLDHGTIIQIGETQKVVARYLAMSH